MDETQIEELLSLGTIDEEIADLLRERLAAGDAIDATRGHSPTVSAGRGNVVPNYGDAIGGIFTRGREEKRRKAADAEIKAQRANRDRIVKDYGDAVTGRRLEDLAVRAPRIGTAPPVDIAAEQAVLAQPAPPRPAPAPAPAAPPAGPPTMGAPAAPPMGTPPAPAAAPPGVVKPPPGAPPMPGAAAPQPTEEDLIALLRAGNGASGSY